MSQSPLARSTRRTLPVFSHHPSRLSKSTTTPSLSTSTSTDPSDSPSPPAQSNANGIATLTPKKLSTPTRYRNSSTSTSTTPVTPKILYSPYATSSPHAGPSRSASIPFDMAASAKAARRAEVEQRERPAAQVDPIDMGEVKPKRFIRKKSIWQRMTALPEALIDKFIFDAPTSILDILPPAHLANPIALGIHAIHYFLLAPLLAAGDEQYSVLRTGRERGGVGGRWDRWEETERPRGRSLTGGWFTFLFTLTLFLVALSNTTYLFTRYKTYDMQLRSARDPVPAPKPSSEASSDDNDDVFSAPPPSNAANKDITALKTAKMTGHVIFVLVKFLYHATLSAIGKPSNPSSGLNSFGGGGSEDKIQSLRVWEPPEFCLAFFCAYPPTAPILSCLLISPHPFLTPLLHLSTTLTLAHLATSYAQLVKDRMFLSAEVMREYDQRFVYRRVFASRVDRGTQTHEAEMVW